MTCNDDLSGGLSGHVSTETNSSVGEREIKIRQGNCAASGNLTGGVKGSEERGTVCSSPRGNPFLRKAGNEWRELRTRVERRELMRDFYMFSWKLLRYKRKGGSSSM